MKEQHAAGGLPIYLSHKIQTLWELYKEDEVLDDCAVITAEFGKLGSVVIRTIVECEPQKLKYESGNYDYISIKCETQRILWTDYSDTEPYNRQCGLYCSGASFDMLGDPIFECDEYRIYRHKDEYISNISFGVWGYEYNDYYGSIRFGICIKKDKVEEFIEKLREFIKK